ncbi:MAG: DUF1385 domain-containing protein [Deltaproteobacteria bacterium]|nr:DUF1385 domain-containing protein [Deltaproteobacteria bacterium]
MMRSPTSFAIAVRKPNGEIATLVEPLKMLSERSRLFRLPIVRGVITLISALFLGVRALNFSADMAMEEVEGKDRKEKKEMGSLAMGLTVAFSLGLGVLLFFVLPLYLAKLLKTAIPTVGSSEFSFNLVDGAIRVAIFIVYIMGISMMKDIKRVFQYHGAEHKSIYAFEAGEELTVENARKYSSLHPRCGTSFLLTVMLVSILVFSFLSHEMPFWKTALSRLVFIPLIAGLSYEFIRYSGKKIGSKGMGLLMAPGLWLQKLTTREPSDDQLEVALISLKEALKNEPLTACPLPQGFIPGVVEGVEVI